MKKKGFTLVELLVVIAIIALLMGILMPALARVRQLAFRMTCGTNLSGIGKAMLIYANDYEDELPRAGARTNNWAAQLPQWAADTRQMAYGSQNASTAGTVTTSSSLYLLVKYAEVTPKSFVCKGESDTQEFKLADWQGVGGLTNDKELIDVWDFGTFQSDDQNTAKHCSYSYHVPFASYALTVSHEPTMAVAADRNPWCDPEVETAEAWSRFIPDLENYPGQATAEQAKEGNSRAHQMEGQNVLYLDSHVSFEKRSFTGIENDNIYTWQNSTVRIEAAKGQLPSVYQKDNSKPRNRRDSVLVQENGTQGGGSSGGSSGRR